MKGLEGGQLKREREEEQNFVFKRQEGEKKKRF